MDNILIFKTASDATIHRLFEQLRFEKSRKICLIQSSLKDNFQKKYHFVSFIDIKREGFYGIEDSVIQQLKEIKYEKIYIPITGVRATNFGNIVELCTKFSYEELVFYNCNAEQSIIKKQNRFKEKLIKIYISLVEMTYKK